MTRAPVPNSAKFQAQLVAGRAEEYAAIVMLHAIMTERVSWSIGELQSLCTYHKASIGARFRSVCPYELVTGRDESI